jgi:ABC-type sugar transport system substrate-binding protein
MKTSRVLSAALATCALSAAPAAPPTSQATSEWTVQLEFQTHSGGSVETYGCTGEQLNDEWVFTARHCVENVARMNVYQSNDQIDRGEPIAADSVHAAPCRRHCTGAPVRISSAQLVR